MQHYSKRSSFAEKVLFSKKKKKEEKKKRNLTTSTSHSFSHCKSCSLRFFLLLQREKREKQPFGPLLASLRFSLQLQDFAAVSMETAALRVQKAKSCSRVTRALSTQSEDGRAVQGQGTAPVGDKGVSASRSKLRDLPPFDHSLGLSDSDVSSDDDRDSDDCSEDSSDENELEGYRLVDVECLSSLISSACCCSECGGVLSLKESKKSGLASELSLICCSCGNVSSTMTSK